MELDIESTVITNKAMAVLLFVSLLLQRHAASCNRILEISVIAKSCQQESQILAGQHPSQCICSIPLWTLCFLNLLLPFSFPSLCACCLRKWEKNRSML